MPRIKKSSSASATFKPTSDHQITLGDAHQLVSSISAYGKIVTGITMDLASAGTVDPKGGTGDLQLALVYGISDRLRCITLRAPEKVYLPAPDGPADGCGWDPKDFVVWKNLPRNWKTVHVQTVNKPLAMALGARDLAGTPSPNRSSRMCFASIGSVCQQRSRSTTPRRSRHFGNTIIRLPLPLTNRYL